MVEQARMNRTQHGLVPSGPGWYVLNAREAAWGQHEALGRYCSFEGDHRFAEYGVNIHVLLPGEPNCMYHGEDTQEDFLVLAGECLLIVEGQELRLGRWDFVHCPPWTEHVFVGAGDGPCAILMTGTRREDGRVRYPVDAAARARGAGVERETDSPEEAYARWKHTAPAAYREGDLPG
jgi:uncharacterized cupin superfamily protein